MINVGAQVTKQVIDSTYGGLAQRTLKLFNDIIQANTWLASNVPPDDDSSLLALGYTVGDNSDASALRDADYALGVIRQLCTGEMSLPVATDYRPSLRKIAGPQSPVSG